MIQTLKKPRASEDKVKEAFYASAGGISEEAVKRHIETQKDRG